MTDTEREQTNGHELRVAIVGAGPMARHHARAIQRCQPAVRLVAVADPSRSARDSFAEVAREARAFPSLEELLSGTSVDAVHICSPPRTHEPLGRQALEAGCHVYIEKPFAETLEDARSLTTLAHTKSLYVCAGHQLLFEAPAREGMELLPAVGNVSHIESYFSFRPVRGGRDGQAALSEHAQLLDILPHPIYLLLAFLEAAAPEGSTDLVGLEVGRNGTIHALARRQGVVGTMVVTLEGRPIESYVRVVGRRGTLHADFVRGTVQRLIGPGVSGIDKLLNPFRLARQLAFGTTFALSRRLIRRERSYPGLREIFEAFYDAIRSGGAAPLSTANLLESVQLWQTIANTLTRQADASSSAAGLQNDRPRILVSGGTGFLGREVVRQLLKTGAAVRVVARRPPPGWRRLERVEYVAADLSAPVSLEIVRDVDVIIHCAAETSGGWDEHQRNSLDSTEHLLRAASEAGVDRVLCIGSLAVLAAPPRSGRLSEKSPLEPDGQSAGPYVWGKLESERRARELGEELGVHVRVVRPGAIVDYKNFEPPGRLGKRIGNLFVAVGSPGDSLGIVDRTFCARTLVWLAEHFDEAPATLNLLSPTLPTKRELVERLRRSEPDLRVVWLPRALLSPLSWLAVGIQKIRRPNAPAIDVAKIFAPRIYDTSEISRIEKCMQRQMRPFATRP